MRGRIAEVPQNGANKHARAAYAGVTVDRNVGAIAQARCGFCDTYTEGHRGGQVHIADRVVEECDAKCGANFRLGLEAQCCGL